MRARVLVLNGPNLSLLGRRNPALYGELTLDQVEEMVVARARELGLEVICRRAEGEGEMVREVQGAADFDGMVLNPGALAHYSYSLRDALEVLSIPVVEVHISNIHAREAFRRVSVISPVVRGVISGLGVRGYLLALEWLASELGKGGKGGSGA